MVKYEKKKKTPRGVGKAFATLAAKTVVKKKKKTGRRYGNGTGVLIAYDGTKVMPHSITYFIKRAYQGNATAAQLRRPSAIMMRRAQTLARAKGREILAYNLRLITRKLKQKLKKLREKWKNGELEEVDYYTRGANAHNSADKRREEVEGDINFYVNRRFPKL